MKSSYSNTIINLAFIGIASGRVFRFGVIYWSTNPKSLLNAFSGI